MNRKITENRIEFVIEDWSRSCNETNFILRWDGPLTGGWCDCRGTHVCISKESGVRELFPDEEEDAESNEAADECLRDIQYYTMRDIIDNLAGELTARGDDSGRCFLQPFKLEDIGTVVEDCLQEDHQYWLPDKIRAQPQFGPETLMLREMFGGVLHIYLFTAQQRAALLTEMRNVLAVIERENVVQKWV